MLDPQKLLIGPVRVAYGGQDMGLTTDDGVSYTPEYETQKFQGAQSPLVVHKHRSAISAMLSFTVAQMTQKNWHLLEDLAEEPAAGVLRGRYKVRPTEREIVLTGPGPDGGTRVMVATGSVSSLGEVKINNKEYQGLAVEIELLGDPETNELWVMTDSVTSGTVPNPASFATVTSGDVETSLADAATGINPALSIQANFPVAIRPDQVNERKFFLKTAAGNTRVAGTLSWGKTTGVVDYTKVKFTPTSALTAATAYDFIIVDGVLSQDGIPGAFAAIQFTTA